MSNGAVADYYPEIDVDANPKLSEAIRILYDHVYELRGTLREERKRSAAAGLALSPGSPEFNELRAQLLANFPATALNVTNLLGVLSQPQTAGIPVVTALPDVNFAQPGEVVSFNNILYIFDATNGVPGTWTVLSTAGLVITDTHANRVVVGTAYPPADFAVGTLFWETDRTVFYMRLTDGSAAAAWVYVAGMMRGTVLTDQRPVDLGTNAEDDRFLFYSTDFGVTYVWDGTSNWDYFSGYGRLVQTFTANTLIADPNATTRVVPAGTPFRYGLLQDGTGGWVITWNGVFKGVTALTVGRTADRASTVEFDAFSTTQFVKADRGDVVV